MYTKPKYLKTNIIFCLTALTQTLGLAALHANPSVVLNQSSVNDSVVSSAFSSNSSQNLFNGNRVNMNQVDSKITVNNSSYGANNSYEFNNNSAYKNGSLTQNATNQKSININSTVNNYQRATLNKACAGCTSNMKMENKKTTVQQSGFSASNNAVQKNFSTSKSLTSNQTSTSNKEITSTINVNEYQNYSSIRENNGGTLTRDEKFDVQNNTFGASNTMAVAKLDVAKSSLTTQRAIANDDVNSITNINSSQSITTSRNNNPMNAINDTVSNLAVNTVGAYNYFEDDKSDYGANLEVRQTGVANTKVSSNAAINSYQNLTINSPYTATGAGMQKSTQVINANVFTAGSQNIALIK